SAPGLQAIEVVLQPGAGDATLLQDTYIEEWFPEETHGGVGALLVRGAPGAINALMRWDLSSLPSGAHVLEARLELWAFQWGRENPQGLDISIYQVLTPWQEASATWQEAAAGVPWGAAGCNALGLDREASPVASSHIAADATVPGWFSWDVTPLVQTWLDHPSSNHGMILIASGSTNRLDFWSSEAGALSLRPRLVVRYTDQPPTITPTASATPTTGPSPTPSITPSLSPTPSNTPGPTLTPTKTPTSWIDVDRAVHACCIGGSGCVYEGDTTGKPDNARQYGSLPWTYPGPEDVYIIQKSVVGDLTATIEYWSGDLDIILLYDAHPSALLKWDDKTLTCGNLAPGTYYLVVDGFEGSMGPYRLTLICSGEPTPTPTLTPTPSPTNTPVESYYPLLFRMPTPTPTNTPTPTPTPTFLPYEQAVNCGSSEGYLASDGAWYAPDQPYHEGSWGWSGGAEGNVWETGANIAGTDDDPIYRTHRYAMVAYYFDVPPGRYEVLLRFAEIFKYISVGGRVFAVEIENHRVLDHFDMLAVGARNRAWDGIYYTNVTDGLLSIAFIPQSSEFAPAVNAIRVRRVGDVE
ncbi:MAG: DNRLRE domain-containing protein, partial [Anaerolineae bacterium]|nr:DNRLRE domain-containing protein [Anaerolineae bacterium]